MRIVLAVEGTRGDVAPTLALAEHLRDAKHDVVFCGPPDALQDCWDRGFEFHGFGVDVRAFLDREGAAIAGGRRAFAKAGASYFKEAVTRQFASLPRAAEGADLIVGSGVCLAGSSVAEALGVPYRFIAFCPVMFPSREHAPFVAPSMSTPRWVNRLLWRTLVPPFLRLVRIPLDRERRKLGLDPLRDAYRALVSERPILAAAPALAPVPADCPYPVDSIGCLHPWTSDPLPDALEAFLAAGKPPVYVGFGSMTDGDPTRTTARVLRAAAGVGRRVVLSGGWARLGDGPLPASVFRVGNVDHHRLFPRVAAVVHHGGAGTTTTAARAGVPQIVVPHGADQYWWGARVRALGVGPRPIPRTRLDAPALEEALASALDDEAMASRALDLAARLRTDEAGTPGPLGVLG